MRTARKPDVVPIRPSSTSTPTLAEMPEMLTVDEVGRYLRVGRDAAYAFAAEHGVRVGRLLRVPRAKLEALMK